jgi:HK97 family phage portal protein
MAWYNKMFSRGGNKREHVVEIETKSVIGADTFKNFLIYGALDKAATAGSALKLYDTSTAVSIPINKISEKFASLTPILMIDGKKVETHPLLTLLKNPCPDFSKELFFLTLAINYLVTGESFFISIGNGSSAPKQLYPMNPKEVDHITKGGYIVTFTINGDHFPGNYERKDDVFWSREGLRKIDQIRNYSIKNNSTYRGRSKLVSASDTARQQILGTQHNLSILEKGGKLSLLFHFDSELDDDEFQVVKERVQQQFGGADKAGSTMITAGGGLSVENLSQTAVDMDWAGAQKLSANVLALTYDYPLPLLTLDASTMSNYQSALEALYDDAVIPISKVIYGALERSLFPRFSLGDNAILTFDEEKVPALLRRRNEHVNNRANLGVESDNEIRNMLGREDYPGGNIIYKPANLVPVGDDFLTDDDDPSNINIPDDDDLNDDLNG